MNSVVTTRIKASGTITLAAVTGQDFLGVDSRQLQKQIIVSNLDASLTLKLRTINGTTFATIQPASSFTFETTEDIQVYNPDGASTVDFEVCQLFVTSGGYDSRGYQSGTPERSKRSPLTPGPPGTKP